MLGTGEYLPRSADHADRARHRLRDLRAPAASRSAISSAARNICISVFEPLLAGIYSVPIILFLPLYVLFFGLGPGSKIALGTTISFFPIVLNTIAGFGYVDRIFITAARSMGASDFQMFRYVLLPAALPVILTGPAHRLHRRAALHPRQRDHRLARRPRPPHRASGRRHGDRRACSPTSPSWW